MDDSGKTWPCLKVMNSRLIKRRTWPIQQRGHTVTRQNAPSGNTTKQRVPNSLTETLSCIYWSRKQFSSYLNTCCLGPGYKVSHKQIASTSKARLKTYVFYRQQHAIPLLLKSNFLPIQMIYFGKTASLMYDISTNKAPSLIKQLFTKAGNVHAYGTTEDRPLEETITLNLLDLKFKKTRFRVPAPVFGTAYL